MKYRTNMLAAILASTTLAVLLIGCDSGSSTPAAASVSGVASKGPLNGASVCAYAITNGLKGAALGICATTSNTGSYSIDLGSYTGPVLFESTGGTYVDEATNTVTSAPTLHSMLTNVTGGATTAAITALTELAYQLANAGEGGLTTSSIQAAVASVQTNFGVSDIVATLPIDALAIPGGATAAQKTYALALATVSQYAQTAGSLANAMLAMQTCLAAPSTNCGSAPNTVGAGLNSAMGAFVAGHAGFIGDLPVANFGSVTPSAGGGGGAGGGSTGVAGPVVDLAKLASLCTGAQTSTGSGTEYSGCNGANISQNNIAVLNAINAWLSTSAHGAGMTVYNSNYAGVSVGATCSFGLEPGLGLWMLTVNNTPVVLTPGNFDGAATSTIEVNAAGEVVRMALGDFLSAGREISFLNGKIDAVYQSISGANTTTLFCGNAN
jgi:hypothetical protein